MKKEHFDLSPMIVWIVLWIVKTYSEFQVKSSAITEILQHVKVFTRRRQRRREGYTNTCKYPKTVNLAAYSKL